MTTISTIDRVGLGARPISHKGTAIAVLALLVASQIDQGYTDGRDTDAAFSILRQIGYSFGW